MNAKLFRVPFPGLAFLILLSACSGGNVGNVNIEMDPLNIPPLPSMPTSEAITAHGVIDGLAGVTVNDVSYAANTATVTINGQPGTLSDLRQGQIVTVSGRIYSGGFSGTADSIIFDANVIGPVENLDAANNQLTVMGQTVIAGPETLFDTGIDPVTFDGLSVGTVVQIAGFANAAGAIKAMRIDPDTANSELQLIGKVTGLDLGNLLFTIDRLTVDYSGAVFIDLPGGAPANGMTVKAIGTLSNGLFNVDRLVRAADLTGSIGQRVQTAGLITRIDSPSSFYINDSPATVDAGTAFVNGEAGDLDLNAEVVIDGDFATGGRITANRITFGRLISATAVMTFGFSDFTEIYVPTVFNVTVTQGANFSIEVSIDEEATDRVDVTQTGSRLNFALTAGNSNIQTLEAFVTMPVLDRIELTGVANATLNDFTQTRMTVNVGGVSHLRGNALTIDELTASVSGVSQLDFGNIRPIGQADIDVSGVSRATLNMDVGSTLTGSVGTGQGTGISALFYYGTNVVMDVTTDFPSSVTWLGDTRQ